MRAAIRQKLIIDIPEIQERCYEPHAAGPKTQKPYLVIRQGTDTEDTPWTGFRRIIEVWPYASRASFKTVDLLGKKVTAALEKQILTNSETGEVFNCVYLGTVGDDFVDEEWDAITRGLRFAVMALQPVNVPETTPTDPWTEAIALWTEEFLGNDWTVYCNSWPLGYTRPSVLWRISEEGTTEGSRAVYKRRVTLVGHVLGRTPGEQISNIQRITDKLKSTIKIPLDEPNKRYLTIANAKGDNTKNPMTMGQLSVSVTARINRLFTEAPLMQKVTSTGNLKEGEING